MPLTIVGGVGAAVAGVGIQNNWGHRRMIGWLLGLVVCIGIPALRPNLNRLGQGRRAARGGILKLLGACAVAYGYPQRHVRVNVMLPCRGKRRRRVDASLTLNMATGPDQDLEIDATAGVTGEAWSHRTPAYGDLSLALSPGVTNLGTSDFDQQKQLV